MHIYCRESVNNLCFITFCISVEITNAALGTTKLGEFSLIWEKKGQFLFPKLHFLQSSLALASFPGGAFGGLTAFLAPSDFVFFFFLPFTPFPLAHIGIRLGTVSIVPVGKSTDSGWSSVLHGGENTCQWLLRDCGLGQIRSPGNLKVADGGLWIGWEGGEPKNRYHFPLWSERRVWGRGGGLEMLHREQWKCSLWPCPHLLKGRSPGYRSSLCWNPALALIPCWILIKSDILPLWASLPTSVNMCLCALSLQEDRKAPDAW